MRGARCWAVLVWLALGCGTQPGVPEAKASRSAALQRAGSRSRLLSQLAPRLEQRGASLTPVMRSDGGRSLRTNGRFSQAQMARIGADGAVTTHCVDSLEAAAQVVRGDEP